MTPIIYFSFESIIQIHERVIQEFGGKHGIRDRGLLESALAIPFSSFGGEELHPTIPEKAASTLFHLCSNHAFLDGNKRIAVAAAEVFLMLNEFELRATDLELYNLTIGVAEGKISKDKVVGFFKKKSKPLRKSK